MSSADPDQTATGRQLRALAPDLKRTLYGCLETIQATKAALYLAGSNADTSTLSIVSAYGYTTADRETITERDPLMARLLSSPNPIVVNDLATDPQLAEVLFRQSNDRLLAIPILGRGRRLIGILDLRDKAGKQQFSENDVTAAKKIASDVAGILSTHNLFGIGPISLVKGVSERTVTDSPQLATSHAAVPELAPTGDAPSPAAIEAVRKARERMSRRGLDATPRRRILTRDEFDAAATFLPAVLAIPSVLAASLTSIGNGGLQAFVSNAPLSDDAMRVMNQRLALWMRKPEHQTFAQQPVKTSLSDAGSTIDADHIRAVASIEVASGAVDSLALSIAFEETAGSETRDRASEFSYRFGSYVSALVGRSAFSQQRFAMAEKLLEPDFQRWEVLSEHCRRVAGVAQRFAMSLQLPEDSIDNIRIAALVHDVGLRLLDFDEMSVRATLSQSQRRTIVEHPLVGAVLVEPVLGPEVAEAVLRHHERWDGSGYPGKLAGNRIPIGARIIQICDAWVSMTSSWYPRPVVPEVEAASRLRQAAGTQFDPSLVGSFLSALDEIVN